MKPLITLESSVDDYFAFQPENVKIMLEQIRRAIKTIVPDATELISYQMPAFKLNGILVWYAAYKNHIGFYPSSTPIKVFKDELTGYKTSKGAIQFPIDKPIPLNLICRIVEFRVQENAGKTLTKNKK